MYKPALTFAGRGLATLALLAIMSSAALAQDRYRAEVVVLERLADPLLQENMAGKLPEPVSGNRRLWVVDDAGNRTSDINLTSNLTLNNAAARLENSGKYRILMKTGWIQRFPQNYNGEPLTIELGDYLSAAGHRAIEGTIEINRRRFLLVTVALNHWREASGSQGGPGTFSRSDAATANGSDGRLERAAAETGMESSEGTRNPAMTNDQQTAGTATDRSYSTGFAGKELVTWIRETRRMRSREIHFVDSPSIGVLLYFQPLD